MVNKTQTGNHASQKLDNGSHMFVCVQGVFGCVWGSQLQRFFEIYVKELKDSANLS